MFCIGRDLRYAYELEYITFKWRDRTDATLKALACLDAWNKVHLHGNVFQKTGNNYSIPQTTDKNVRTIQLGFRSSYSEQTFINTRLQIQCDLSLNILLIIVVVTQTTLLYL